jgi:hypothetical protein
MKKNNLIKVVLFLTIIISTVLPIVAQNSDKPLTFGAKLGIASSGFTQNQGVFTLTKLGFAGGVSCEYKPIKLVGISLELNYVQQGAFHIGPTYIYPPSDITIYNVTKYESDVTLHTINLPLLVNFSPITEGNIFPKISLGFALDYIFYASSSNLLYLYNPSSNFYVTLPEQSVDNVTSSFKSFNYGPVAGLGLDFKTNLLTYSIGVRYSMGLRDINNLASLNNVTSNSYRFPFSYNSLNVLIGVSF